VLLLFLVFSIHTQTHSRNKKKKSFKKMAESKKGTIRFEDLGAPIQRLFKQVKGISEEDMALVQEFVSVKDMAKIFQELGSDRGAEAIWAELRAALLARKEKQMAKQSDYDARAAELEAQRQREAEEEAEEERLRLEEEEKAKKKADKRRKKAEAAAAAAAEEEERLRLEAEAAEAERLEQERLAEEARIAEKKNKKRDTKKEWEDFVASHPLEYSESAIQEIQQKPKETNDDGLGPRQTLAASTELLTRTWTPYCPHCHAKYSKPPPEWDCSMCLRKFRQHVKCWQPDDKTPNCMVCKKSVGRFTRHHCRNCGRVCCGGCTDYQAKIVALGYSSPQRVCRQCVDELGTVRPAGAAQ
jgi:hypothetical protein